MPTRSEMIRQAAAMPKGSVERKELLLRLATSDFGKGLQVSVKALHQGYLLSIADAIVKYLTKLRVPGFKVSAPGRVIGKDGTVFDLEILPGAEYVQIKVHAPWSPRGSVQDLKARTVPPERVARVAVADTGFADAWVERTGVPLR